MHKMIGQRWKEDVSLIKCEEKEEVEKKDFNVWW